LAKRSGGVFRISVIFFALDWSSTESVSATLPG